MCSHRNDYDSNFLCVYNQENETIEDFIPQRDTVSPFFYLILEEKSSLNPFIFACFPLSEATMNLF